MAEKLSVKERIERRVAALLENAATAWASAEVSEGRFASGDAIVVERWTDKGNTNAMFSILVIPGDESVDPGGQGNDAGDVVTMNLRLACEMQLVRRERVDGSTAAAQIHNRWLARIVEAVMADRGLVESDTGEQLAVDVLPTGSSNPPGEEEQPEFFTVAEFEVIYDVFAADPYAAPGVTEKSV